MRITGGTDKGRKVYCPPGTIRPVMDRMRESIFAILGQIKGCSFLDLFSGSGIMALEAASRGAERVHAVERDSRKKAMLRKNLATLTTSPTIYTMSIMPVEAFIDRHRDCYNTVFLDPPFAYKHRNDLLQRLADSHLLYNDSEVCLHFPSSDTVNSQFTCKNATHTLLQHEERKYGQSLVAFYRVQQ